MIIITITLILRAHYTGNCESPVCYGDLYGVTWNLPFRSSRSRLISPKTNDSGVNSISKHPILPWIIDKATMIKTIRMSHRS